MKTKRVATPQMVPTSNFTFDANLIDVESLSKHYRLYGFEIPAGFNFIKDPNKYAKLHNCYKEQMDHPYYFYSFYKPQATLFMLVKNSEAIIRSLSLDFLETSVAPKSIDIAEITSGDNLHILVKLLLSSFFFNQKKNYRICQGDFYLHSSNNKKETKATVLKLMISQTSRNLNEFVILNKATHLYRVEKAFEDDKYLKSKCYFELVSGETYYRQVKTSYVLKWLKNGTDDKVLYTPNKLKSSSFKNDHASIKWFEDYDRIRSCKSFLILEFQNKFIKYINDFFCNAVAQKRHHLMHKVKPLKIINRSESSRSESDLNISQLKCIGLFDNRLQNGPYKNERPFKEYLDFFNEEYGNLYELSFISIPNNDLKSFKSPVLIIQDVEKSLFEKDGLLFKEGIFDDPKIKLYEEFSKLIPLQTLNVNINEANKSVIESYFDYPLISKETFKHKIGVCLNELYLKNILINRIPIRQNSNSLPLIKLVPSLLSYCYMYKGYFLYIDNSVINFQDLRTPKGKMFRNEYLDLLGINWNQIEKRFSEKHKLGKYRHADSVADPNARHEMALMDGRFIFGPNLALEIEDTEERVLHSTIKDNIGMSQRKVENKTALEGVYYSDIEGIYTVGAKTLGFSSDDSVRIRQIYYFQKPSDFDFSDLLQSLLVQFVRNKQYTVYPYFFDLINLYRNDIVLRS